MTAQAHHPDRPDRPTDGGAATALGNHRPALSAPIDRGFQWLVLDTNVALGWLLFGDPACRALAAAIEDGGVRFAASPLIRRELVNVLQRGVRGWPADAAAILATWDAWGTPTPSAPGSHLGALRCTDSSDQKFIDLALAVGASGLLSRDRAVLKLARRARPAGLVIETPEQWAARATGGSALAAASAAHRSANAGSG